ncbi:MAG TPA: hypothetical protein VLI93_08205 [Acetobacteraceae bacterium]|nr:hypothetical protein [Acetobacteraceae bacterium]
MSGVAAASLLLGSGRHGGAGGDSGAASADDLASADDIGRRGLLTIDREIRAVLTDLIQTGAIWQTRFDVAVQPDLEVRADRRSFHEALAAMVGHAAGQVPSGRVLITAARRGGRIQISVTDGGAGADRLGAAAALRSTESLIAMQGGTFEINARPAEGTTLIARWPDAPREKKTRTAPAGSETESRDSTHAHKHQSEFGN